MESAIIDYYNETPNIVNVIDKMNDELKTLQEKYDLLKKTYEPSNNMENMIRAASRTDNDMAKLLYKLYGKYNICSGIKNNKWYHYDLNMKKWRLSDNGIELRIKLSNEIHNLYEKKAREHMKYIYNDEETIESHYGHSYLKTCMNLKKPLYKAKIMKECKEVFYKKDFVKNNSELIEDLTEYYEHDPYGDIPIFTNK